MLDEQRPLSGQCAGCPSQFASFGVRRYNPRNMRRLQVLIKEVRQMHSIDPGSNTILCGLDCLAFNGRRIRPEFA